jgi:hypothetical protein
MVVLSHPVMVQRQATAGRQRGAAGTGMVVLSHHVMVERQARAG